MLHFVVKIWSVNMWADAGWYHAKSIDDVKNYLVNRERPILPIIFKINELPFSTVQSGDVTKTKGKHGGMIFEIDKNHEVTISQTW